MMVPRKVPSSRTGNSPLPAKDRRVLKVATSKAPAPLRPLEATGLAAWQRLHESAGWLTEADFDVAQVFCEMLDEREGLRQALRETGSPTLRTALRKIDEVALRYARDLGVAPAYRATLGMRDERPETNKIEAMRRKAQGLHGA